jgi:hypothetical protein
MAFSTMESGSISTPTDSNSGGHPNDVLLFVDGEFRLIAVQPLDASLAIFPVWHMSERPMRHGAHSSHPRLTVNTA